MHQIDVDNAFLNGTIDEEVYTVQPQGFETQNKNIVCKLQKSLYGLKQAPHAWFQKVSSSLAKFGFVSSKCDSSFFTRVPGSSVTYILAYVDVIIITGNTKQLITKLISDLNRESHSRI